MRVTVLALDALTPADLGRWSRLGSSAVEPNPFFEPEMVVPGARALGHDVGLLVAAAPNGEWEGCMPVESGRGFRRLPLRANVSWIGRYTFLGAPLLAPNDPERALAALLGGLMRLRTASFAGLDLHPGDGPVAAALPAAASAAGARHLPFARATRAALRRGERALGLSRKHEREVERLARRLGEHLGAPLEVRDRAGEASAVEDFLRLEASGWKAEAGTAFASEPRHAEFLRGLCRDFAAAGRLQLQSLDADGRVVAMKLNLRARDTIYCFKIAHDASLARYSPGIQLELVNLRAFEADRDIRLMDSCAHPANAMINRLWAGRREIGAHVFTAGARGFASRPILRAGASIRSKLRHT